MLEKLILYITTKGLGTCWMAGTFNKGEFFKAMGPGSDEVLPVVSPVGYPSRIKSPVDLLLKPIPGHRPRKPWGSLFFKESLEKALDPQETGPYAQALAMVRLAPSAANRQPWRIIEAGGEFRFYLAHDPLAANRHAFDVQKIDMGIAMCHFECTAAECGLKGRWEVRQPEGGEPRKGLEYIATWVPV